MVSPSIGRLRGLKIELHGSERIRRVTTLPALKQPLHSALQDNSDRILRPLLVRLERAAPPGREDVPACGSVGHAHRIILMFPKIKSQGELFSLIKSCTVLLCTGIRCRYGFLIVQ